MKTGIEIIAEERKRQIEKEGYTQVDDARYENEELVDAAICYALGADSTRIEIVTGKVKAVVTQKIWPWKDESWKPTPQNRIKELAKAGALIAAEIDRLKSS